jgi:hypothetical protein
MDLVAIVSLIGAGVSTGASLYFALRMFFYLRQDVRVRAKVEVMYVNQEALIRYLTFVLGLLGFTDFTPFEIENQQLFEMFKERQLKKTMVSKLQKFKDVSILPEDREKFEKLLLQDKRNVLRMEIDKIRKYRIWLEEHVKSLGKETKGKWKRLWRRIGKW